MPFAAPYNLRKAIDAIDDMVYLVDPQGICREVWGQWPMYLGIDKQTLLHRPIRELAGILGSGHLPAVKQALHGHHNRYNWITGAEQTASGHETYLSPLYDDNGRIAAAVGVCRNVTPVSQTTAALTRLNRIYAVLAGLNEVIAGADSVEELFYQACRMAVLEGKFRFCWIGRVDPNSGFVKPVADSGGHSQYLDGIEAVSDAAVAGGGPAGQAVRRRHYVVCNTISRDPCMAPWREQALQHQFRSLVVFPLQVAGEVIGTISFYADTEGFFQDDEIKLLASLVRDLALAVNIVAHNHTMRQALVNLQAQAETLNRVFGETVAALARVTGYRDAYTADHQQRVAVIAVAIARELRLPHDRIEALRFAGLLHDIGKVAIPIEILVKPNRLTAAEFQLIKGHSQASYDILKTISFPWPVAAIALQHHERLDGSGYPFGLSRGEIMSETRILSVADVVEAMASHRPYRPALGMEQALAEITAGAGSRYDAEVVDACHAVSRHNPQLFLPNNS